MTNPVVKDHFYYLTKDSAISIPILKGMPMYNHGNYLVSLGKLTIWLGEQAEALGVEIYPATAASEVRSFFSLTFETKVFYLSFSF